MGAVEGGDAAERPGIRNRASLGDYSLSSCAYGHRHRGDIFYIFSRCHTNRFRCVPILR